MAENRYEMLPYVHPLKKVPDSGIVAFLETPRYSTGYTALFNTIGFMPETHMLKPFADRAWATYDFMLSVLGWINKDHELVIQVKKDAEEAVKTMEQFPLQWTLDITKTQEYH